MNGQTKAGKILRDLTYRDLFGEVYPELIALHAGQRVTLSKNRKDDTHSYVLVEKVPIKAPEYLPVADADIEIIPIEVIRAERENAPVVPRLTKVKIKAEVHLIHGDGKVDKVMAEEARRMVGVLLKERGAVWIGTGPYGSQRFATLREAVSFVFPHYSGFGVSLEEAAMMAFDAKMITVPGVTLDPQEWDTYPRGLSTYKLKVLRTETGAYTQTEVYPFSLTVKTPMGSIPFDGLYLDKIYGESDNPEPVPETWYWNFPPPQSLLDLLDCTEDELLEVVGKMLDEMEIEEWVEITINEPESKVRGGGR